MRLLDSCWLSLVSLLNNLSFSSLNDHYLTQRPLLPAIPKHHVAASDYPVFDPPNGPQDGTFTCEYPNMTHFTDCSTPDNRGCWLKGPNKEFNIKTDYENEVPIGVTRKYYLEASQLSINADGVVNEGGKAFNKSYPGPWIQACWGDELEITVKNDLTVNGTTIHWHGIRQLNQVAMDGVNGITQCPIAPGQNFTYKFRAMQYGSSWYHSHYSLQVNPGKFHDACILG